MCIVDNGYLTAIHILPLSNYWKNIISRLTIQILKHMIKTGCASVKTTIAAHMVYYKGWSAYSFGYSNTTFMLMYSADAFI